MRRWKILLCGAPGAGKSTLSRTLLKRDAPVVKTQSPEFHGNMLVDLPGEFLTVPRYRMAFLATAQDVHAALYLVAANEAPPCIPAGLLQTTPGLTLTGVITKVDAPDADVERCRQHLKDLGLPAAYYEVCCMDEQSVAPLRHRVELLVPGSLRIDEEPGVGFDEECNEKRSHESNGDNGGVRLQSA